jgi:hypothetical protein
VFSPPHKKNPHPLAVNPHFPNSPTPGNHQSAFSFCLFWTFHVNEILHWWSFESDFFHLESVCSRLAHIVALSVLSPSSGSATAITCSPVGGHSGCFPFLAGANKAAVHVYTQLFAWACISFPLGVYLGVELLGHGKSPLTFWGIVTQFPNRHGCCFSP